MVNSQHFKTYTGLICFYNKMGSHKAESMSDARVLSLSCEMRKTERDLWIETSVLVSLESCPSLLDAFRIPQLTKHTSAAELLRVLQGPAQERHSHSWKTIFLHVLLLLSLSRNCQCMALCSMFA